jgi:hypothetical protein
MMYPIDYDYGRGIFEIPFERSNASPNHVHKLREILRSLLIPLRIGKVGKFRISKVVFYLTQNSETKMNLLLKRKLLRKRILTSLKNGKWFKAFVKWIGTVRRADMNVCDDRVLTLNSVPLKNVNECRREHDEII